MSDNKDQRTGEDKNRETAGQQLDTPAIPSNILNESLRSMDLAESPAYWIGKYEEAKDQSENLSWELRNQQLRNNAKVSGGQATYYEGIQLKPAAVAGAMGTFSTAIAALYYLVEILPAIGIAIGLSTAAYYFIDSQIESVEDEQDTKIPQFSRQ